MAPDAEALRAILKQYIGPAYDRALRNTGEPEAAKEATRRAMELLKRACMDGVEPTKALVLRITDDCCNEKAFFNRQVEVERQKLQEGDGAEAAPEPAPKGKALLGGKRFQEAAEKPAESHIKAAPVKAQAKAERAKPKPAAEPAFKQTPNRQRTAKARASLQEPDIPDLVLAPGQRKGKAQDQALSAEEQERIAELKGLTAKYEAAMDDDFNTADAIAAVFEMVRLANATASEQSSRTYVETLLAEIEKLCDVLGLITEKKKELLDADIEEMIAKRQQARKEKNFALADQIWTELDEKGIL